MESQIEVLWQRARLCPLYPHLRFVGDGLHLQHRRPGVCHRHCARAADCRSRHHGSRGLRVLPRPLPAARLPKRCVSVMCPCVKSLKECFPRFPFAAVMRNIKDIYNVDPNAPAESTPIPCLVWCTFVRFGRGNSSVGNRFVIVPE